MNDELLKVLLVLVMEQQARLEALTAALEQHANQTPDQELEWRATFQAALQASRLAQTKRLQSLSATALSTLRDFLDQEN